MKTKCFKCGSENVAKRIKSAAKARLADCGLPTAQTYCGRCISDAFNSAGKLNTGLSKDYRTTISETEMLVNRCKSLMVGKDGVAYEKLCKLKSDVANARELSASLVQDFDEAIRRAQELSEIISKVQINLNMAEHSVRKMIAESYEARRHAANRFIANEEVRKAVVLRDGARCRRCSSETSLSLDHIIPVVEGGRDQIENLQVLCTPCNSAKGGKLESY